eukprot:489104-Amphidinium_carterae.1
MGLRKLHFPQERLALFDSLSLASFNSVLDELGIAMSKSPDPQSSVQLPTSFARANGVIVIK